MLLPLIGIFSLFFLSACSRKNDDCPKGSDAHSFRADGKDQVLCHRETGAKDGIYQGEREDLSLRVQDRFISVKDKAFEPLREKFRLPNFEGMNLKNWAESRAQIFPQGTTGAEADRFLSLLNYLHVQNLSVEAVLPLAQKMAWLNPAGGSRPWKSLSTEDRLDSLALAGLVQGLRGARGPFYGSNRPFVDTVIRKMDEGRLRLQRQTDPRGPTVNALTEMTGRERSAGYNRERNILLLGLPLDVNSLPSLSHYLHELFHFYQDATKQDLNFLEMESSAYAKQGEFVAASLKTSPYREKYSGMEPYLRAEYPENLHSPDGPILNGLRLAAAPGEETAQSREALENSVQRFYYFQVVLKQKAPEEGNRAANFLNRILFYSEGDLFKALFSMNTEAAQARQVEMKALQDLEGRLRSFHAGAWEDVPTEELVEKFQNCLSTGAYRIFLEQFRARLESGNREPLSHIEVNLDLPEFLELYQRLGRLKPLQYQRVKMDGVE